MKNNSKIALNIPKNYYWKIPTTGIWQKAEQKDKAFDWLLKLLAVMFL